MDNRLSTADVGNNSSVDVTYKFDALGRRVYRDDGTTAEVFVQAGQQTIADYVAGTAASSPTYRYVYASYIDEPVLRYQPSATESLYYHRNQQYSVTALTDGSGAIAERHAYSAYGVPTITNASGTLRSASTYDNRYLYTGREWDDVILMYHYRARMYDAELGRFCSKDPIGYEGSRWSVYEYVRGASTLRLDPLGLQTEQHHHLPRQFTDELNRTCGHIFDELGYRLPRGIDALIDEFTSPHLTEVHRFIHNRLNYNQLVQSIFDSGASCCLTLEMLSALISSINRAVVEEFWPRSTPIRQPQMYPYTSPNPFNNPTPPRLIQTNDVFDQVIRDVCGPPKCPVPTPIPFPVTVPVRVPIESTDQVEYVCTVGVGMYVCYRVIRM
ncbi:MAG: RHS repeat-associated core domain-containing protein, partial [Pirellulaceae bacterium]